MNPEAGERVEAFLAGRFGMLVRIVCRPGMRPALLEALNTYTDGLDEEPGTEIFVVSVDPDNGDIVWLYEVFKDQDAQQAHQRASGFGQMIEAMGQLLAEPPGILRFDPLRLSLHQQVLENDFTL